MNEKETAQIISLIALAYPASDMARSPDKITKTVKLWSKMLYDVPYRLANQTIYEIIRENKFAPSIAEFREAAKKITDKLEEKENELLIELKSLINTGCLDKWEEYASRDLKEIIKNIGTENLTKDGLINSEAIEKTFIVNNPELGEGEQ